MNAQKLTGVNELPSPTWNHLSINNCEIEVPERPVATADEAREAAEGLAGGMGRQAAAWLWQAARTRRQRIEVKDGQTLAEPVVVALGDEDGVASTELVLGEGSSAEVAVVASAEGDAVATLGSRLRLELGERAHARVHVLCALPAGRQYLDDLGASLADEATLEVTYHLLGADMCACGLDVEASGYRSSCAVDVHYLGRDAQKVDLNYVMRLRGRKSKADFDAYGVLSGTSSKVLRDTIDLVHGCKGAAGREQETVLLANQGVTNKSLPVILCDEDDVQGDHGATVGAVSPEQLSFLMQRGLSEAQVEALFARSVIDHAVAHATVPQARAAALAAAGRVLGDEAAREIADALVGGEE